MNERRDHARRLVVLTGVAGANAVFYTVPLGWTSRIVAAWGTHDEGGLRQCQFIIRNEAAATAAELSNLAGITAVTERRILYADCPMPENLILGPDWSIGFTVAAIGGAAHSVIYLVVEERKGEQGTGL